MQIPAPPHLAPFVKHFIYIQVTAKETKKYRLFPNGNTGLVFTLNNKKLRGSENSKVPYSCVFGQLTDSIDILMEGNIKVVIVVFQPFGLCQLTKIPGSKLRNSLIEADLIFGNQVLRLHQQLCEVNNLKEIILLTENFLVDQFLKSGNTDTNSLPQLVRFIIEKKGAISVKELTKYSELNKRKLQRLFLERIGLSAKRFIQIIKVHYFIGLLRTSEKNLTQLTYHSSYFDQSHLIKEFKKITSFTPNEYLRKRTLTVNFIELGTEK